MNWANSKKVNFAGSVAEEIEGFKDIEEEYKLLKKEKLQKIEDKNT